MCVRNYYRTHMMHYSYILLSYMLTQEQIDAANEDKSRLQLFKSFESKFGYLANERKLDQRVANNDVFDLFERANRKSRDGEEQYITEAITIKAGTKMRKLYGLRNY